MGDFFNDISSKKIIAIIVIGILLFFAFYKERFLLSNSDNEHLNKLSKKTNNKLSGRTIVAIIWFSILILSLTLALIFY